MFGRTARQSAQIRARHARQEADREAREAETDRRDQAHRRSLARTQARQLRYGRRNHGYDDLSVLRAL